MIIIRSFLWQITIANSQSYVIFTIDYDCDEDENIVPHGLDTYEYGDLIIQTDTMRFTVKKTYAAYDYCVRILEEIKAKCREPVIYIDMEELNQFWSDHAGELIVEPLR